MVTEKEDVIIFMIEELTKLIKLNNKAPQIDFSRINTLTDHLRHTGEAITESIAKIDEVSRKIQQPVKTKHRHTFDIRSSYAFVALILLGLTTVCLAYALITERQ